jgi:hypothetical protein
VVISSNFRIQIRHRLCGMSSPMNMKVRERFRRTSEYPRVRRDEEYLDRVLNEHPGKRVGVIAGPIRRQMG